MDICYRDCWKGEPIQKIIVDQIVTKTKPQQRFKKQVQMAIPKPVTIEDTLEVIGEKAQFMCQMYTEASSWGMVFPIQTRIGILIIQILVNLYGLLKGKLTKGNLAYVMVVVQTIH